MKGGAAMEDGGMSKRLVGGVRGKSSSGSMKQAAKPKIGSFQAMGLSHELFRGVRSWG